VFFEPALLEQALPDLCPREMLIAVPMVAMILWLGLYPQPVLDTARPAINAQLQAYKTNEKTPAAPVAQAYIQVPVADSTHIHKTRGGAHEPE